MPPGMLQKWSHTNDCRILQGFVAALGLEVLNCSDDALAVNNLAKYDMLLVEMWCRNSCNEKLGAVGSGAGIRHAQQEWPVMDPLEVFVFKLLAINALATSSIALCEVTALLYQPVALHITLKISLPSLDHEALDDAVEA